MFERLRHQQIARVLEKMDAGFLREAKCYFGGGTAITMLNGEYRESLDLDFLCADQDGYRMLRASVFDNGLKDIFPGGIELLREVRTDRDGIRAVLAHQGLPIKFEIVREARIGLNGVAMPGIPVMCLTKIDLFAEKLLANADRYADKSVMSRDLIDLLMMERHWGKIPDEAMAKAVKAYGKSIGNGLDKAKDLLRNDPA